MEGGHPGNDWRWEATSVYRPVAARGRALWKSRNKKGCVKQRGPTSVGSGPGALGELARDWGGGCRMIRMGHSLTGWQFLLYMWQSWERDWVSGTTPRLIFNGMQWCGRTRAYKGLNGSRGPWCLGLKQERKHISSRTSKIYHAHARVTWWLGIYNVQTLYSGDTN